MQDKQLKHLAIILDGNRRWAKSKNLPKLKGHKKGSENLLDIAKYCFNKEIDIVSAYVFSTENWKRDDAEVEYLMDLIISSSKKIAKELKEQDVVIKIVGSRVGVPEKVLKTIEEVENDTKDNTGKTLALLFNYGGQQEVLDSVKRIIENGHKAPEIDEDLLKKYMYSNELPSPDMIVRTSNEHRLSNFWLWDSAYAELMFMEKNWPDFEPSDIDHIIDEFHSRQRRFGK